MSSGPVSAQHVVVVLIGIEFRPARAGLIEQTVTGCFVVEQGVAGGPGIATDAAVWGGLTVLKHHVGSHLERKQRDRQQQWPPSEGSLSQLADQLG